MRILSASANNFASYEKLEFDFTNQGLTLIQGPTGSGKSTLCDLIPWVLFGVTAKGGPVNDVLAWPGNSVTKGTVWLYDGTVITRVRGPKAKDNDLYFEDDTMTRGKDLVDTQRLINQRLGITADLYLAGAYYHEFSQTAQFFTTNAKNRRAICEQIVDLSMPKTLQEKAKVRLKEINVQLAKLCSARLQAQTQIETLERLAKKESESFLTWDNKQFEKIDSLEGRIINFEDTRAKRISDTKGQIRSMVKAMPDEYFQKKEDEIQLAVKKLGDTRCSKCGGKLKSDDRVLLTEELHKIQKDRINNKAMAMTVVALVDRITELEEQINPYEAQLIAAQAETNPHTGSVTGLDEDLQKVTFTLKNVTSDIEHTEAEEADLELLQEVIADFRTVLISHTIVSLQDTTNKLLSEHFDAEIRVEFSAEDADKLEVQITKDGNLASYTQLSKGQRQLLKLSFGIAIMQGVANHHAIDFSQIFFDEALDGLDDNMKAKAFGLFSSLETDYESIFLVEHSSEMKARFNNQFMVSCLNGVSTIEKA